MNATRAQILEAVNNEPHGITSAQLARKLGATAYNVSGILSKLAAYGLIVKGESLRQGRRNNGCLWKPKPYGTTP